MASTMAIDAASGRAAILNYDTANPWTEPAFTDPVANFGQWRWHNGVDYLGWSSLVTGTVNLNKDSGSWTDTSDSVAGVSSITKTLFAHGRGFAPVLMGYIVIGGAKVPAVGNALYLGQQYVQVTNTYVSLMVGLNIWADSTNVYITVTNLDRVGGYFNVTTNVNYGVYVCNMGLTSAGAVVRPPLNEAWDLTPERLKSGRFDTTFGYFNRDDAGDLLVYKGRSIDCQVGANRSLNSSYTSTGLVLNVNGYQSSATRGTNPRSPFPGTHSGSTPIFSPSTVRVAATPPVGGTAFDFDGHRFKLGDVFSTDQKTLLIPNVLTFSTSIQTVNFGSTTYTDTTQVTDLGAVHANANIVLGVFKIGNQVRSIGGTNFRSQRLFTMPVSGAYAQSASTGASLPALAQYYWFEIASSRLRLNVRTMRPRANNGSLTGASVSGVAFCGAFDF